METLTTKGVVIEVNSMYRQTYCEGQDCQNIFSYQIHIINKNEFPIQVISRYWRITDSFGYVVEVNGEGIVGEQPIILPNSYYEYTSGCNLNAEMGTMEGKYICQNIINDEFFEVAIPKFLLCMPVKLN